MDKEARRAAKAAANRKWQKTSAVYVISHRTRMRVRAMFGRRHPPPLVLLGCSWKEYANHLGGMPGADEQIDHIIPLCRYDLNNEIDVMHMFNWQNTQLLKVGDHAAKGSALPDHETLMRLKHLWPVSWWPRGEEEAAVILQLMVDELSKEASFEELINSFGYWPIGRRCQGATG